MTVSARTAHENRPTADRWVVVSFRVDGTSGGDISGLGVMLDLTVEKAEQLRAELDAAIAGCRR